MFFAGFAEDELGRERTVWAGLDHALATRWAGHGERLAVLVCISGSVHGVNYRVSNTGFFIPFDSLFTVEFLFLKRFTPSAWVCARVVLWSIYLCVDVEVTFAMSQEADRREVRHYLGGLFLGPQGYPWGPPCGLI